MATPHPIETETPAETTSLTTKTQEEMIDDAELEEINLDDDVGSISQQNCEKSQLLQIGSKTSQHLRPDNLAPHNYHDYNSSPASPKSPPANTGGIRAIRSVSGSTPDTAQRSKLPVQTQIKQITVLQLEKMGEFGIFKNTGGITGLPDGRL